MSADRCTSSSACIVGYKELVKEFSENVGLLWCPSSSSSSSLLASSCPIRRYNDGPPSSIEFLRECVSMSRPCIISRNAFGSKNNENNNKRRTRRRRQNKSRNNARGSNDNNNDCNDINENYTNFDPNNGCSPNNTTNNIPRNKIVNTKPYREYLSLDELVEKYPKLQLTVDVTPDGHGDCIRKVYVDIMENEGGCMDHVEEEEECVHNNSNNNNVNGGDNVQTETNKNNSITKHDNTSSNEKCNSTIQTSKEDCNDDEKLDTNCCLNTQNNIGTMMTMKLNSSHPKFEVCSNYFVYPMECTMDLATFVNKLRSCSSQRSTNEIHSTTINNNNNTLYDCSTTGSTASRRCDDSNNDYRSRCFPRIIETQIKEQGNEEDATGTINNSVSNKTVLNIPHTTTGTTSRTTTTATTTTTTTIDLIHQKSKKENDSHANNNYDTSSNIIISTSPVNDGTCNKTSTLGVVVVEVAIMS